MSYKYKCVELPASLEGSKSYWLACFGQGSRGGEPIVTVAYLSVIPAAPEVYTL